MLLALVLEAKGDLLDAYRLELQGGRAGRQGGAGPVRPVGGLDRAGLRLRRFPEARACGPPAAARCWRCPGLHPSRWSSPAGPAGRGGAASGAPLALRDRSESACCWTLKANVSLNTGLRPPSAAGAAPARQRGCCRGARGRPSAGRGPHLAASWSGSAAARARGCSRAGACLRAAAGRQRRRNPERAGGKAPRASTQGARENQLTKNFNISQAVARAHCELDVHAQLRAPRARAPRSCLAIITSADGIARDFGAFRAGVVGQA